MRKILLILLFILLSTGCTNENLARSLEYTEQTKEIPPPEPSPPKIPPPKPPQPEPPIEITPTSNCDPNYSGCVPIARDVDCAGGSGNGPAYVSGPVKVIGTDIYRLDRDNDGYGCE